MVRVSAYRGRAKTDIRSCGEKKGMHALHGPLLAYMVTTMLKLLHARTLVPSKETHPVCKDVENMDLGFEDFDRVISKSKSFRGQTTQTISSCGRKSPGKFVGRYSRTALQHFKRHEQE